MLQKIKNNWILIFILSLGLSVSWPLLRGGYFSHQDDLHIIRLVEMRKCFSDFQLPCRWVPDMGWGNGMPLFNFYGVSTYYIGGVISFVTGYLVASKILFILALIGGSFGVYLLVSKLWGKYAGLTSSILYLFAPYKALDIYVRGALTESLALAIIPFVLYFGYKKNYKFFVLTLFLFLITHNIMTIIFLPVVILWMSFWLYQEKFKDIGIVVISFVLAAGLSSFFLIPAFLEKGLVQTESLTRFELDYRANFISIKQLFLDRVWGYGTSIPGPLGGMNFSIGTLHWILAVIAILAAFFVNVSKKSKFLIFGFGGLFLLSIFMTHNKSSFVWTSFPILSYFQFPWRFLSLSVLTTSILGGFVITLFKDKLKIYASVTVIILAVLLNWSYFKPREFSSVTETEKTSGKLWEDQRKGALLDYLPKTALEPREGAPTSPIIISGDATTFNFINKSNSFKFDAKVTKDSVIDIPIYYFPNWEVVVNGKKYPSNHNNLLGRISINLPVGQYKVEGVFKNTRLRTAANMISLLSFVGLIILWKRYKK